MTLVKIRNTNRIQSSSTTKPQLRNIC